MKTNSKTGIEKPYDGRTFVIREVVEYAVTLDADDCLDPEDGHALNDEELRAVAEEAFCQSRDPFAEFDGAVIEREVYEE